MVDFLRLGMKPPKYFQCLFLASSESTLSIRYQGVEGLQFVD